MGTFFQGIKSIGANFSSTTAGMNSRMHCDPILIGAKMMRNDILHTAGSESFISGQCQATCRDKNDVDPCLLMDLTSAPNPIVT